jgi:hypothetical protein
MTQFNCQTPPALDGPTRPPLSAFDLSECVDRHLALGQHSHQPCVLELQLAKKIDIVGIERAVLLLLDANRLLAEHVIARGIRHRSSVSLPQHRDHLLFTKSALPHRPLAFGARPILSTYPWH